MKGHILGERGSRLKVSVKGGLRGGERRLRREGRFGQIKVGAAMCAKKGGHGRLSNKITKARKCLEQTQTERERPLEERGQLGLIRKKAEFSKRRGQSEWL